MKALSVGMVLCFGLAAIGQAADNLIKDPGFQEADFAPLAEKTTWLWYQIAGPSSADLDKAGAFVSLEGGKTFLHSSAFDVVPGQKLSLGLKAEGTGKVSVECLWWTRYDDDGIGMAKSHRTIPLEPVELKGEVKELTAVDTPPEDAKRAYIRIVVEEGKVAISAPSVTVAP